MRMGTTILTAGLLAAMASSATLPALADTVPPPQAAAPAHGVQNAPGAASGSADDIPPPARFGGTDGPEKPACARSVALTLHAWDVSLAAAEKVGAKAGAIAKEKGKALLLPLLGAQPGEKPDGATPDTDPTEDVANEVEASRHDPERRAALCSTISRAAAAAKEKAGSGLEALKRMMREHQPSAPAPAGSPLDPKPNLIKS